MSHELVDRKFGVESLLVPYLAFLQIDRHLVIVDLLRSRHESRHFLFAQSNRKETILRAIVRKNVCERRRNYRPEPKIRQGPHRMLARRSAPKVLPGDQNARALIPRLVQNEVRILLPICSKPPVVKDKLSKPGLLNALQ